MAGSRVSGGPWHVHCHDRIGRGPGRHGTGYRGGGGRLGGCRRVCCRRERRGSRPCFLVVPCSAGLPLPRVRAAKVVAANIDTVFVCDALDGSLGLRHLERFLALAWQSGATPVVVITKSDAVPPQGVTEAVEAVKTVAGGASVVVVSSRTGDGVLALEPYLLPGRTVALLGLSGAGKSTLANLLAGAEILATGAVRRDGSGRHTTTHRRVGRASRRRSTNRHSGNAGAFGPRSGRGGGAGVRRCRSASRRGCRYPNCSHSGESGCAIAAALSEGRLQPGRLEAWLRLRAERASSKVDDSRGDIAERKRRKAAKFAARRASKM